jgi:hypothetical protein
MFSSTELVDDLRDYCEDNNKRIETTMLITPFKDQFIFEIKVIKHEA